MKEFIKNQKVTYNLMSFTGYKALLLFSLLSESPKSYNDISDYFFNHPYLRERISIDTLRVYINSLKRIGCEIKRTRGEDKISRYMVVSHPFELKMTPKPDCGEESYVGHGRLKGRKALVTGADSGIGRAAASRKKSCLISESKHR